MEFARQKADANGEFIQQRYTELSDAIRARNKVEDRLLNVRLKFYEREKKVRLNIIHSEQRQLERIRTTLYKETEKIQVEKQTIILPSWMLYRPKLENQIFQLTTPEILVNDWKWNSTIVQSDTVRSNITNNIVTTIDNTRCHTA
ncbi:unnamed protein product [Rotaria sp. Silwood1]|nr:unnamed protein product [Rotaria sp. Silwood1]CAF1229725.1 unnamed protein product [Rotaria sp. Silwood1]CAF1232389.1 unnamed protein product [Rotaria sp. Silwood1]CAF3471136.1 unnamed protein product [Rotaria sp. Silwood1]CAF3487966.1 unnamed protein product [Rotaria sp. Silwood1]